MLAGLAVMQASGEVRWLETKYDFGLMKEAAGPKTGQARFVNTGSEAVNVLDAKPSCGCTGATYPQDPVMPGDTAVITFTYDPAGRPGRFDKTIKVRFDNGRREVIRIVGNVLGTPESLAQFYPVEAGSLRLSDSKLIAGTVTMGKSPSLFVNAYNTLNDSVRVKAHTDAKGVKLKLSENAAGPGDIVTLANGKTMFRSPSEPKGSRARRYGWWARWCLCAVRWAARNWKKPPYAWPLLR